MSRALFRPSSQQASAAISHLSLRASQCDSQRTQSYLGHSYHVHSPGVAGWMYLVAILDWYSRFVVSWELDQTMQIAFVMEAMQRALD